MRKYTPKNDVQAKSYFNDRFFVAPETPKRDSSEDEIYAKDIEQLRDKFEILNDYIEVEELVIYINPEDNINVITFLRDALNYEQLMELSAIDYIADRGGFEIFYEMLSLSKRKRLRIKTFIRQKQPIESVYNVFRMASWAEREMYDMYGVKILNHPNMKRIIMPDDWYDHPLRKTYPLTGDEAANWYEVDKIFGKEYRDVIGPEIRDCANVDRYDTERFSRLGHEVPKGVDITDGKEPEHTPLAYQEEGGIPIIKKLHEDDSVTIKERR
ncbi:NADH-quinone oxidoreductase subunit C [Arcobacter sp. LA11]|uniref:NADH-quinone oxidoreductase subunit C n=1 Tax=Arcobacter sp. LA11 TaxID=1898176 RepID=UPI000933747A|nr:NADH-quinone oxidoreductase subunit C [Arcobacter sp. LA11]